MIQKKHIKIFILTWLTVTSFYIQIMELMKNSCFYFNIKNTLITQGKIIEIGNYLGDAGTWGYKFQYVDFNGVKHINKSRFYTMSQSRFNIGEKISIIYEKTNPLNSIINTFSERFLGIIIHSILNIFIIFLLAKEGKISTTVQSK